MLIGKSVPEQTVESENHRVSVSSAAAQTRLFFTPSYRQIAGGRTFDIPIHIDTASNNVNLIQLELWYNPNDITILGIRPGSFLTNPTVILSEVDSISGAVQYALKIPDTDPPQAGSGDIAILTLIPTENASPGATTQISFRKKSSVRGPSQEQTLLQSTEDLVLEMASLASLSAR